MLVAILFLSFSSSQFLGWSTDISLIPLDLIIFIALDLAALTVQSIGGARASQAAENNEDADPGGRIMLGGIILQMGELQFSLAYHSVCCYV